MTETTETEPWPMAWPTDAEQANDSFKVWTTLADPETMAFGASIYQSQTREYDVPRIWLTWTDFKHRSWRQTHRTVSNALVHLAFIQRQLELVGRIDPDGRFEEWMDPVIQHLSHLNVTDVTKE